MEAVRSSALQANLEETRRVVGIPTEQQVLLEITVDHYGIHQRLQALLGEFNHPFANWEDVIKGLRATALGDLAHYLKHSRSVQAVTVFWQIFQHLFSVELPFSLEGELLRTLLEFISSLLKSSLAEQFVGLIQEVLDFLVLALPQKPDLWARSSTLLRRIGQTCSPFPQLSAAFNRLFRQALVASYRRWLDRCGFVHWHDRNRHLFSSDLDLMDALTPLRPEYLQSLIEQAEAVVIGEDLLALPHYGALVDMAIQVASEITEPVDRAQFLLYLLGNDLFANREHWILSRLSACLRTIGQSAPEMVAGFIRRFFSLLEAHRFERKATVFDCILTLGRELDQRGNLNLVNSFIDHLLLFPFETADVRGVTSQWEVLVNPHHLPNVRLFMRLIELNPARYRRLLSALIIQLVRGDLFVADTDLFQKDVTLLLNADIGPLYNKVKQLARMFPVYFGEIGAEGELRDASTEIDQVQQRRDPLIHFLRKQVHVESNSTQVDFVREIMAFWTSGDKTPLKAWLPVDVYQQVQTEGPYFDHVHEIFKDLEQEWGFPGYLIRDDEVLARRIEENDHAPAEEQARAKLLIRLHQLLQQKYSFSVAGIEAHMRQPGLVDSSLAGPLLEHLSSGPAQEPMPGTPASAAYALETLSAVLDILEALKKIILDPAISHGDERIYRKRHIAVGIPSMYGVYRERKFEALGLTFRLETLARQLYAKLIASTNLRYVTRKTLGEILRILTLLVRAVHIDGMYSASLERHLDILAMGLQAQEFSVEQLVNVFQFIAADVQELTERYFIDAHAGTAEIILSKSLAELTSPDRLEEVVSSESEKLLRELITAGFGLQYLDDFVGKVLTALTDMRASLNDSLLFLVMSCDPYRLISPVYGKSRPYDNSLHLGNKGYILKQLASHKLPVPEGFIVTTEFFRCQAAMSFEPMQEDIRTRIGEHLTRLEAMSGRQFGCPQNPLLLSVRSGAVMSMPGIMSTLLNVGLNDDVAEALGQRERYAWAVWDSYRRLIQSWAMAHGVDRDVFDEAIQSFKQRYGAEKKMQLIPEQMRELAYCYKRIVADHGVALMEEPFEQLVTAIQIVLQSWFSERAAAYRRHLGIAEQWGTAAIIQRMVLGNLDEHSGSGVVLSRNPLGGDSGVALYGDYIVCSQGEDVVSGLVNTLPISEVQGRPNGPVDATLSLEQLFPEIYRQLQRTVEFLVCEQGYPHQEIEFTFESERPQDFYVLQARDMVYQAQQRIRVFVASDELRGALLGQGIGAGGGAISGRVAFTMADIATLRECFPHGRIVLIRPDTVPDDFSLIAQADGLLTARGGCTSHAAVAAQRLGKTCVVNCRALQVYDRRKQAELGGQVLSFADFISIDGRQGTIYAGEFPTRYEEMIL